MLIPALLAISLATPESCALRQIPGASADSLDALYQRGRSYAEFLEAARARRETWLDNTKAALVAPELLARARALAGEWKLLVVAEDWCGDSANTIPYLAALVDSLPSLSFRIVSSAQGRWVMDRYRTPDGRAVTPTVVLLDPAGDPRGCFIERPAPLREALSQENGRRETVLAEWRRRDAGQSTMREIVELLESAVNGTGTCLRNPQ